MGVYFLISLDFRQFFDDLSTAFSVLGIFGTLLDPMQTLKVTRAYIK